MLFYKNVEIVHNDIVKMVLHSQQKRRCWNEFLFFGCFGYWEAGISKKFRVLFEMYIVHPMYRSPTILCYGLYKTFLKFA